MTQQETADWMGCTVEQMNRAHDALHLKLCEWLGVVSQSLRVARRETLIEQEHALAALEEDAVLHLQRFMVALGR